MSSIVIGTDCVDLVTGIFWEFSFKPNADDIRETPSIVSPNLLTQEKAKEKLK